MDPELVARLIDAPELLGAARDAGAARASPSAIVRMREQWPADLVAAALSQAHLRIRGEAKFGAAAAAMLFTSDGLEQASRPEVAAHRAARFAAADLPLGVVADLCCGIGGDLLALDSAMPAERAVLGVDSDPATVAVAAHNLRAARRDRATVTCADVRQIDVSDFAAAFIDPARRSGGRRTFDPAAYSPPLSFVESLADQVAATGAKVAPGIPHDAVPAGVEAQWVSWQGDLKEAALWFGPLATASRRATLLPSGATLTERDLPDDASPGGGAPVGAAGPMLYEPDAAVIRSGLVAAVAASLPGGRLLDSHIAYIAADAALDTPFAVGFAVQEVLPYSLRRLRSALRSRRIGIAEIKVRGLNVDPAQLRVELALRGDQACTVLLARLDSGPVAIIAQRIAHTGRGNAARGNVARNG
jgi:hypothetical protein